MTRIPEEGLASFVETLAEGLGADAATAEAVATSLVSANLCGHHSHGVRMLAAKYAPEISDGKIEPAASPVVERADRGYAIVDGRTAFGQAVGRLAVDELVSAVDVAGTGVVGVRNVSHLGRIGEWAERVTDRGFAFVGFVCNPGSQYVAPAGSATPRLSTNPITIGVPTFDALPFPIVLDVATSQVAHGKMRLFASNDEDVPEDLAVTSAGEPLTDPERFLSGDGALLPLGGLTSGYKGFGLAALAELLAANVGDGSISGEADPLWGNHAAFVALDLARFTTRERLEARISAFARYVRDTEPAPFPPGVAAMDDELMLPGEPEYRRRQAQREEGIALPAGDAALLVELARELGVEDAPPRELAALAAEAE